MMFPQRAIGNSEIAYIRITVIIYKAPDKNQFKII